MVEKVITLNNSVGINTRYAIDHKPVVLFIHFSGGNLHIWDGVLPLFEKEYSIIAPDLRGHGKSDKPLGGYHIDDMAEDMYLLLQQLKVDRCYVVGSSLGAEVGLSLAASHPEMVLSLVCEGALFNEFGEYGLFNGGNEEIEQEKEARRVQIAERGDPIFKSKSDYIEKQKASFEEEGLWNEFFAAFLENSLQETEDGSFTYCYPNYVRTEYITKYWDLRFEDYYSKVRCPVLILPSEEEWDNDKIQNSIKAFTSLLDTYEIQRIAGSLHAYVWMQFPTQAGEVVRNFISK